MRADWPRTVAIAFATLACFYAVYSVWRAAFDPIGVDLVSSWAAGRLVWDGASASAYDMAVHRAVERQAGPLGGLLPFPYPPPYLFVAAPLGLLPFWAALAGWIAATAGLYLVVMRRRVALPYSLAHPAALPNVLVGQNGFLVTAIIVGGVDLLGRAPVRAGLVLGCLVLKPQMALMLPVALLAAGQWRTIAVAAATATALCGAAALVFGPDIHRAFLAQLPEQAALVLGGGVPWHQLASPFALLRGLAVPQAPALGLHAVAALAGAVVTWICWRRSHPQRVPVLFAATLLASPYLYSYDTLPLVVPIVTLLAGGRTGLAAAAWLLCLLPVASFAVPLPIPNTTPVAVAICLYGLLAPRGPVVTPTK
jgi:hypothetical protein